MIQGSRNVCISYHIPSNMTEIHIFDWNVAKIRAELKSVLRIQKRKNLTASPS